jgi:hypothetical protein
MSALCVLGSGVALRIAASAFTLSWTHTVEKTLWLERWSVAPDHLLLTEAEVEGSGAGMDPAPDARLVGDRYVWRPDETRKSVILRRDPHAGDWRLCAAGRCAMLGDWLGVDADPVTLKPASDGTCEGDSR